MGLNATDAVAGANARALALAVLLLPGSALAQSALPTFDLEHLSLNPGARDSLLLDTGDGLRDGELRATLALHYQDDSLVYFRNGERIGAVVGSRWTTHLAAAYGVLDVLEVSLQLPIILAQSGDDLTAEGISEVGSTAMGAPILAARYTLLREQLGDPLDLGLQLAIGLPLGSEASLSREPGAGFAFTPKLGLGRVLLPWLRLGGELGLVLREADQLSQFSTEPTDEIGHQLTVGLVASTLGDGLRGELNAHSIVPLGDAGSSMEFTAGARYPFVEGLAEAFLLGGPGLGDTPGTPLFRVLGGVALTPFRKAPCKESSEYELVDCPTLDRDGDGIANHADVCPVQPGVAGRDGCPDKDTDGDGVMDLVDACPTEHGAGAADGCLVKDADGDGVLLPTDECPTEKGPADRNGCPMRDADKDGTEDAKDACPDQAGPAATKGCPDQDGDGIEDTADKCPAEPGIQELQGCPKPLVKLEEKKITISEKVFFETGKAVVLERSMPLLKQVAALLQAHPELTYVRIEGHTDDTGTRERNTELSGQRAEAVKAVLTGAGVEAGRLEAKGFGPDKPIADNKDEAGREKNRRVEFTTEKSAP